MKSEKSFPLRHISIRVPWHDSGWNGTVCQCPTRNTACLKLVNIAEKKDEAAEEQIAGRSIRNLESKDFPPCVKERATFMADFGFDLFPEHPGRDSVARDPLTLQENATPFSTLRCGCTAVPLDE